MLVVVAAKAGAGGRPGGRRREARRAIVDDHGRADVGQAEPQDVVGAVDVHEQRVGRGPGAREAVGVAAQRVHPVGQVGEDRRAPLGQDTAAGGPQQVVVAVEADLAGAVHEDVEAVLYPEDVVAHREPGLVAMDPQGVADGLENGVVEHAPAGFGVLDPDPVVTVGVDQVVLDQTAPARAGRDVLAVDARGVSVSDVVSRGRKGPRMDANTAVVEGAVAFGQRRARDTKADAVVIDRVVEHTAVADVDPEAGVSVGRVVLHQDVRAGDEAGRGVVERRVAFNNRLAARVHAADADAGAGAVGDVVRHGGGRAADRDAGPARLVVDGVEGDGRTRAVAVDAGRAVHRHVVARDDRVVVAGPDPDAGAAVIENAVVADNDVVAVGEIRRVNAVDAARHGHVVDRHVVGVLQLDHVAARGRVGAVQDRLGAEAQQVQGPLNRHGHRGRAGVGAFDQDITEQRVGAGVKKDRVVGVDVVRRQQGADAGHGLVGVFAAVPIVTERQRVLVERGVRVVHVVVRPVVGDQERLVGGVRRHRQIVCARPHNRRVGPRFGTGRPEDAAAAEHVHPLARGDGDGERAAAVD